MAYQGAEVRTCRRFEIQGATVTYKQKKGYFQKEKIIEEHCPLLDISRGGIKIVGDIRLKIGSKTKFEIFFPDDKSPVFLKGIVMWSTINPGKSYKYQTGIQFVPFGQKRGYNNPRSLAKIVKFEKMVLES